MYRVESDIPIIIKVPSKKGHDRRLQVALARDSSTSIASSRSHEQVPAHSALPTSGTGAVASGDMQVT